MLAVRRAFALWALLNVAAAVLIALPDDNARVFSITEDHGPAPLDLVGMLLAVAALVAYVVALALARAAARPADCIGALFGYLAGTLLAVWSASTDTGAWWALGIAVALGAQAWLAWRIVGVRARTAPAAAAEGTPSAPRAP